MMVSRERSIQTRSKTLVGIQSVSYEPLDEVLGDDPKNAFIEFATHVTPPDELERTQGCIDSKNDTIIGTSNNTSNGVDGQLTSVQSDSRLIGDILNSQAIKEIRRQVEQEVDQESTDDDAEEAGIVQEILSDAETEVADDHSEVDTHYLCGVCKQDVGGQCMGCEGGCESWFHLSCIGMSDDEFTTFIKNPDAFWECSACLNLHDLPPYKANDVSAIKAVWGTFKGHELYNAINAAYDEVVKWNRNLFMVPTGHGQLRGR